MAGTARSHDGPISALELCARGEGDAAHAIVQDDPSREAAWVHAHLHRVEGDLSNAAYWYARAARPVCRDALETERAAMLAALDSTDS